MDNKTRDCVLCGELMCSCLEHYNPNNIPIPNLWGILESPGILNVAVVCDTCILRILDKAGIGSTVQHDETRTQDTQNMDTHILAGRMQAYLSTLAV